MHAPLRGGAVVSSWRKIQIFNELGRSQPTITIEIKSILFIDKIISQHINNVQYLTDVELVWTYLSRVELVDCVLGAIHK